MRAKRTFLYVIGWLSAICMMVVMVLSAYEFYDGHFREQPESYAVPFGDTGLSTYYRSYEDYLRVVEDREK